MTSAQRGCLGLVPVRVGFFERPPDDHQKCVHGAPEEGDNTINIVWNITHTTIINVHTNIHLFHLMTIKNVFMEPLKKVATPSTTISWWTSELLTSPTPLTLTRLMLLICQSNYIIKQWIYSYEYIWICPRFKSRVLWCLRSQKSYLATSMNSAV